ncbi:MAG TPA: hypothetical protein PLO37_15340 [Candidatus Hydrogenedentes bacterium]|nr:hypothetical protein [Candidatus Hydrogenedentota bacterium]HPG68222.1 hypothetical protein [Candidatus Hydrogenedentota bacterium]
MVTGTLGVLGGKQRYPVRFYEDFNVPEKVGPWPAKIDWPNQWGAPRSRWRP